VKDIKYYLDLPYTIVLKKEPLGGYFVKIKELNGHAIISRSKTNYIYEKIS